MTEHHVDLATGIVEITPRTAATRDDIDAIVAIATRYAWALDTRNFEDLRNVFHPDATGDLRGRPCIGVDAIIARIGGSVGRFDVTQHFLGNHQVALDGDTAIHRCQMQGQHTRFGMEGGENIVVAGMYLDRLVRTPGGWRIIHRVMQQTWVQGNPAVLVF